MNELAVVENADLTEIESPRAVTPSIVDPRPKRVERKPRSRGDGLTYQRGSTWWIQYYVRGKRIRESTHSTKETDANKLLRLRAGQAATGKPVGPDVERTTFGDLATGLLNDYKANGRRSIARIEDALEHLRTFFGGDRIEDEQKHLKGFSGGDRAIAITSDRVTMYAVDRQAQDAANATINRELAALKHAFRLAADAGRVAAVPRIKLLEENNAREGFVEHAQFLAIREALPAHLKDPVSFLYHSGWRVNEMRTLEWRDVFEEAIVLRRERSKSKKPRTLPLKGELAGIIERAEAVRRPDCRFVFHVDGRPLGSFRKSWATACKKAGTPGLLVHDLRRSAVRNLIRAGVSQSVAMRVTGHRTADVFRRYDITSNEDLANAMDQLSDHLAKQPTQAKVVPLRSEKAA
jgi:integrase